jgi:hypothetical protein
MTTAASCSRCSRLTRGLAGAFVGGLLGQAIVMLIRGSQDAPETPSGGPSRYGIVNYMIPVVGAVAGAGAGAWKKGC